MLNTINEVGIINIVDLIYIDNFVYIDSYGIVDTIDFVKIEEAVDIVDIVDTYNMYLRDTSFTLLTLLRQSQTTPGSNWGNLKHVNPPLSNMNLRYASLTLLTL